jgi:parallel beta-helix repeat protein
VSLPKKKFGSRTVKREAEILTTLSLFFVLAIFGIYFAIKGQSLNFDSRNYAAGRTIFLSSGDDLQEALDRAAPNDAIFLKVGAYSPTETDGYLIKDKNIRILGAGADFVNISGTDGTNVFHLQNANVQFDGIKISGANTNGVLIENSNTKDVSFKNVTITNNSGAGIKTDSKTTIQTSLIDQNANGIISTNGELIVENSFIKNSTYTGISIASTSASNTRFQNNVIYKNTEEGLLFEGSGKNTVKNNTILENGDGIIETGTSTTQVINTVVQSSKGEGISLKGSSTVTYSSASNNVTANFTPATLGQLEGNLTTKAEFDESFKLTSAVLKDKGIANEKDYDGTRIDIGAFGGSPNLLALNSKPVINSTPIEFVRAGERYSYEIKATDPDNDKLSYTIINKSVPKWIKLDGSTLSGTPSASDVGFIGVMVVVSDKRGHNIVHPVSINVIPISRTSPGTTTPTPTAVVTTTVRQTPNATATPTSSIQTPTPTVEPTGNDEVPEVSIISPVVGATFDKGNITIQWELTSEEKVESVEIKYSEVGKDDYKSIAQVAPSQKTYTWNAADIEIGKYVLKVEAKEKNSSLTVAEISDEFEVKDVPKNVNTGELVITKISPVENDVVSDFKPLIFVEFKPDVDIDKAKTYLKANGTNLNYQYTKNSIYYEPTQGFEGNKVQIEANIVDTNGVEVFKKWTFSLPAEANPQNGSGTEVSQSSKILGLPRVLGLLVLGVLILGLLGSILYFVVKLVKTVREERQGSLEAEFIEYYDTPSAPQAPAAVAPQPVTPNAGDGGVQPHLDDLNEYLAAPPAPATGIAPQKALPIGDLSVPPAAQPAVGQNQTGIDQNANLGALASEPQLGSLQDQTAPTAQQPAQPVATNDPYLEELKKKYGINGEDTPPPPAGAPQ